ncbi:SMI1/KNR4 family protein [Paenibacillus nuruki]|uniref:SMI1/KNR4 family protein n=1 Tax=Paenibacillus nuruki TaxID=1886670 RepID=UPI002803C29D|nr:SMI1/KNR4 family protein [Paenibacillus nuruki]CAJ1314890.1 SMI1-KNR4 domain-containing protein [Paenibacillus nuruki]
MDTQAQQLWNRIIAKGLERNPLFEEKLYLYEGATGEDFATLERTLGVQVPAQLQSFYRIHNGQQENKANTCFLRNLTLSSITEIIENWTFLQEEFDPEDLEVDAQPGVKPFAWNAKWIPIASNGGGDYLCIDTDPAEEGTVGQVLYFWHDWEYRSVEATSLFEFIEMALQEEETD